MTSTEKKQNTNISYSNKSIERGLGQNNIYK